MARNRRSDRRVQVFLGLYGLLLALLPLSIHASGQHNSNSSLDTQSRLVFVLTHDNGVYRDIAEQVIAALASERDYSFTSKILSADDYVQQANKQASSEHQKESGRQTTITLGNKAARSVYLQSPQKKVINALITQSAYDNITSKNAVNGLNNRTEALFLDQPYQRFLSLAKRLQPQAHSVGILLGPSTNGQQGLLRELAAAQGLIAEFAQLKAGGNPLHSIEPVLRRNDLFIVIPDLQAINQVAARWVLELGYRYRKPVISYSRKYSDAGALASVYQSPEDIAAAIVERLQPSKFASSDCHFSVTINSAVARALKLSPPKNTELQRQMRQECLKL